MEIPGVFVGVRFTAETCQALCDWMSKNGIPSPPASYKLHSTTIASPEHFLDFEVLGELDPPIEVLPSTFEFDVFGKDENCLVLKFQSDWMQSRHDLALELGGTTTFPDFKPHVTLSYDWDGSSLSDLPLPKFPLYIGEEYLQTFKKDWSSTASLDSAAKMPLPSDVWSWIGSQVEYTQTLSTVIRTLTALGFEPQEMPFVESSSPIQMWKIKDRDWDNPAIGCSEIAMCTGSIETKERFISLRPAQQDSIFAMQRRPQSDRLVNASLYVTDSNPNYTSIINLGALIHNSLVKATAK